VISQGVGTLERRHQSQHMPTVIARKTANSWLRPKNLQTEEQRNERKQSVELLARTYKKFDHSWIKLDMTKVNNVHAIHLEKKRKQPQGIFLTGLQPTHKHHSAKSMVHVTQPVEQLKPPGIYCHLSKAAVKDIVTKQKANRSKFTEFVSEKSLRLFQDKVQMQR
jgi:hypothetical protein